MRDQAGKRPVIAMVYDNLATFVKRDIHILEQQYEVLPLYFNPSPKYLLPYRLARQLLDLIRNRGRVKLYIHQSAGYLSFLPCLLGRALGAKNIIIAIGTDAARLPEIGYGHFTRWPLRFFARVSFRKADLILPVHRSLSRSVYTYTDVKWKQQGFLSFVPRIEGEVKEMVNGYDDKKWKMIRPREERKAEFLTVAVKLGKAGFYRKGLDLILEAAGRCPDLNFSLLTEFPGQDQLPPNVRLLPRMPQEELLQVYNNHRFYLQLSMFEGFPNALCEAMQCGCIPVGSEVAGIPDIIGTSGYLLKQKDVSELEEVLRKALAEGLPGDETPENRIRREFPLERRSREFLAHVESLLNPKQA